MDLKARIKFTALVRGSSLQTTRKDRDIWRWQLFLWFNPVYFTNNWNAENINSVSYFMHEKRRVQWCTFFLNFYDEKTLLLTLFTLGLLSSSLLWLSRRFSRCALRAPSGVGTEQFIYYSWLILCVPLSMGYLVLFFIMARLVSTKSPLQDSGTELTITISRKAGTKNLIY